MQLAQACTCQQLHHHAWSHWRSQLSQVHCNVCMTRHSKQVNLCTQVGLIQRCKSMDDTWHHIWVYTLQLLSRADMRS